MDETGVPQNARHAETVKLTLERFPCVHPKNVKSSPSDCHRGRPQDFNPCAVPSKLADSAVEPAHTSMKVLFLLFFFLGSVSQVNAQSNLIAIAYNGRVEHYWVLYTSSNGRQTKITNYHSAIGFFVDTKYLASITLGRPAPQQQQYRVVRSLR